MGVSGRFGGDREIEEDHLVVGVIDPYVDLTAFAKVKMAGMVGFMRIHLVIISCFLRKARPEPDLRYFSKLKAMNLLEKAK